MKLLIRGSAGYLGSHLVRYAQVHGHDAPVQSDMTSIVQGVFCWHRSQNE